MAFIRYISYKSNQYEEVKSAVLCIGILYDVCRIHVGDEIEHVVEVLAAVRAYLLTATSTGRGREGRRQCLGLATAVATVIAGCPIGDPCADILARAVRVRRFEMANECNGAVEARATLWAAVPLRRGSCGAAVALTAATAAVVLVAGRRTVEGSL